MLGDIKVKAGYETALAAALGDDLDGSLEDGAPMQWTGSSKPDQALPAGVTALTDIVNAPSALTARLSQIGVVEGDPSAYISKLKTGQRLVNKDGHVLRWDGFEIRPEAETNAAKRLQQQNRLDSLSGNIAEHSAKVETAQASFDKARALRDAAIEAARAARRALPDLEKRERAAQAAVTQYEADMARETAQKSALEDRLTRLTMERDDVQGQFDRSKAMLEELSLIHI